MYCFPNVSSHYGRTIGGIRIDDSAGFAQAMLHGPGVAVVPGAVFGENKCVRLSLSVQPTEMDEALDRLGRYLAG
jgi:aspartate aminotransferase